MNLAEDPIQIWVSGNLSRMDMLSVRSLVANGGPAQRCYAPVLSGGSILVCAFGLGSAAAAVTPKTPGHPTVISVRAPSTPA